MVWRTEYFNIHFTGSAAGAAGGTLVRVDTEMIKGDFIEQRIKRSQWTDPLAERAVKEHGKHYNAKQNTAFPCEQISQACPDARIGNGKRDTSFQDTGRADVFAEKRIAQPHFIHDCHRENNHKDNQDHIFEIGEEMQLFCAVFLGRNLMQQLLKPSERAEKAAYKTPQQYSNEDQEACDIVGKVKF